MHAIVLGAPLLALAPSLLAGPPAAAVPPPAARISLDEALRLAAQLHPDIRSAEADRRAAEGRLLEARRYPFNPEIGVEAGPSRSPERSTSEAEVSLRQTLELGGKRSKRSAAATARLEASISLSSWTRLTVLVRVRRAYGLAILARHRLVSAREVETIASELKAAADERLRFGAGTLLELNVATAVAGRARAERLATELALTDAHAALAAAVGDPGKIELEPLGERLLRLAALPGDETVFVERALAARPDLASARRDVETSEAEVRVADAAAVPDVTLGVTQRRDGLEDARSTIFGVSLPIPLFNRDQGPRVVARARLDRSRAVEDALAQSVTRDARAAHRRYQLTREAVDGFDRDVVERLGENLSLALQSFQAGKIGLLDFNSVRRELVDTRLALLAAERELVEAQAALELAAGTPLESP